MTSVRADAEDAAREVVRDHWSFGAPEPILPVDPFFIAQSMSLSVFETALEQGVGGLLVGQGGHSAIYLNSNDPRNRRRFTCAHEIGHFVKRRREDGSETGAYQYVDRRDALAGKGTDPNEIWANRFAAELLMPAAVVRRIGQFFDAETLAKQFGVSQDAMLNRFKNL